MHRLLCHSILFIPLMCSNVNHVVHQKSFGRFFEDKSDYSALRSVRLNLLVPHCSQHCMSHTPSSGLYLKPLGSIPRFYYSLVSLDVEQLLLTVNVLICRYLCIVGTYSHFTVLCTIILLLRFK